MNILGIFVLILYAGFLFLQIVKGKKNISYFLVYFSIIFVSLPALKSIVMGAADTSVHMGRIAALTQTILDGYFPQRILTWVRNSYGWAAGIMYPQLFFYIPSIWGAIFKLNGTEFDIYALTNTFVIVMHIMAAEFMYIAASKIYKNKDVGSIAALLITFCSHKMWLAYSIGRYGGLLGSLCIPIYILGIYYIISDQENKWYVLTVGMTFIVQNHLISILLIAILSAFFIIIFSKKIFTKKKIIAFSKAVIFAVLINLAFLIPLMDYMKIPDLISTPLQVDSVGIMSFNRVLSAAGLLYRVLFYITVGMLIIGLIKYKEDKNIKISLYIFVFVVIALLFSSSSFVMPNLNKIEIIREVYRNIQYTDRWVPVMCSLLTLSGCYLVYFFAKKLSKYYFLILFVVIIALGYNSYKTQIFDYMNQRTISNISPNMNWSDYSYKNTSMDYENVINNKLYTNDENLEIPKWTKEGLKVTFSYRKNGNELATIVCPLLYYPGYRVVDNYDKSNKYEVIIDENNLLNVVIGENNKKGIVSVDFVGLDHWKYFDILSFLSLIIYILTILYEKGYIKKENLTKIIIKNKGK